MFLRTDKGIVPFGRKGLTEEGTMSEGPGKAEILKGNLRVKSIDETCRTETAGSIALL